MTILLIPNEAILRNRIANHNLLCVSKAPEMLNGLRLSRQCESHPATARTIALANVGAEKLCAWTDLVLGVWAVPSRSSLF